MRPQLVVQAQSGADLFPVLLIHEQQQTPYTGRHSSSVHERPGRELPAIQPCQIPQRNGYCFRAI